MQKTILVATLCAGLAFAGAGHAQDQTLYGGCVDAHGQPVAAIPDPGLDVAIETRSRNGQAVIHYNHAALPGLDERGHLFLFAHECARLNLGATPSAPRTPYDARRADCWATTTLMRSGLLSAEGLPALEASLAFSAEQWRKVPGPIRRLDLKSCPRHLSPSLHAPAAGQDAWNACARECGDSLFACQRIASREQCESDHARCMQTCKAD